jgi:hypothetical protein
LYHILLCSNTVQVLCFINALFVRVIVLHDPVVHRTMGRGKKIFKLVWRCHQLLSGFLTKGHLPRVSCQSRRSLMIWVTMQWSWGLCTELLAFALQLRNTPRKPQLGDVWWGGCATSHRLKWGPFPPNEFSTSGREKEGNKDRTGWLYDL